MAASGNNTGPPESVDPPAATELIDGSNTDTGHEKQKSKMAAATVGEGSGALPVAPGINTPPLPLRCPPYPKSGKRKALREWNKECRRISKLAAKDPRRLLPTVIEPKDPATADSVASPRDKAMVRGVGRSIVSVSSVALGGSPYAEVRIRPDDPIPIGRWRGAETLLRLILSILQAVRLLCIPRLCGYLTSGKAVPPSSLASAGAIFLAAPALHLLPPPTLPHSRSVCRRRRRRFQQRRGSPRIGSGVSCSRSCLSPVVSRYRLRPPQTGWRPCENMESTSDVQMQHCAEDTETTIEIKIKTLDSQTYNLRVNKCVPVPLLKEKIATVTGILSEQQRLICRGRVLKDDELLSAYHVEDGHTLHLVVRHPGQSATSGNAATEANTSNSGRRRGPTVARSVVLEAVNVDAGSSELPAFVAQILQSVLGTLNAQSSGTPASSDTRPSDPAQSSVPNTVRVELDQQQAPLLFQSEPGHESSQPNVIPDALTTMSQYIDFMRDSFRREGFNLNGQTEGNVENRTAGSTTSVGGTQNLESQAESASALGLRNASLLAENMHSTRQIVVEQAGVLLSQLSGQLGDLENVTDPATRRDIQSSAVRMGSLLQNLGSLLLELGRTTMLLRINPSSSEAVVNSGPALYISPSGPNPLMVQPVPFPGRSVQMGTLFSSLGSQGSVLHPRDVDIHVRTSGSVPGASTNPSESAGAQVHQNVNRPADASHANIGEAFSGVAGGTPFSVESGVRLLPLRTVVAMPAGISRAPSGSSSGGVGIIYPFVTRVRQRASTNGSNERNGQSPNEPARNSTHPNQQSIPQSSQTHEAGNLGSPVDVNVGDGSETSPGQQNGLVTLSQIMDFLGSVLPGENVRGNTSNQQSPMGSTEQGEGRNLATPEVSGASEEALRFASMVRQIMPFISHIETQNQSAPPDSSTPAQAASGSADRARDLPNDSTSSRQHSRDQIDEPNSKRQRTSD